MLNKVPYKTIEIWTYENEFLVIKNSNSRIVLNQKQATMWNLIDGNLTVNEIIEKLQHDPINDINGDMAIHFIKMARSIGMIDFLEEEWNL